MVGVSAKRCLGQKGSAKVSQHPLVLLLLVSTDEGPRGHCLCSYVRALGSLLGF